MRQHQTQMYQGRDWASYRWTVAECFDLLDRIHDLSLCQGWVDDPELAETAFAFVPDLMGLCEELDCQMKLVYADILGAAPTSQLLAQNWAMMESQRLLVELKDKIHSLWEQNPTQNFSALVILTSSLKSLLKKMDQ